jgi:hypothetical protein
MHIPFGIDNQEHRLSDVSARAGAWGLCRSLSCRGNKQRWFLNVYLLHDFG